MSNVTQTQGNVTGLDYSTLVLRGTFTVVPLLIFLYINGVILFILGNKVMFRETPRYILLYNLLFSDTFQLVVAQFMFVMAAARVYMIHYVCVMIVMLGILTTDISPLNLAVMSLERYVAVCFPLRHSALVTVKSTGVSIAVVWAISGINAVIRIFLLIFVESLNLDQYMTDFCSKEMLFRHKVSIDFDKAFTGVTFAFVGIVILCSYLGVVIVANSASSDKDSSSKAKKTVLLHMIQLLLTLSSTLVSPILTSLHGKVDRFTLMTFYYVFFVCLGNLPRCLSGLIYGLRDQNIRPILLHRLSFGLKFPKLGQTPIAPSNKH